MKLSVKGVESGMRIDVLVAESMDWSRSFARKVIEVGGVFVQGRIVKASYLVREGDEVVVEKPKVENSVLQPEDIELDVIYEDSDLIVVNKPAGMVVHPTDSGHNQTGTLVNALLFHCKDLSGIGGVMRPGIVHRLDKGTSGVMVVAKNDMAHQDLSNQIREREVKKEYVTLVKGRLEPRKGAIDAPIGRSLTDRKKMDVVEHGTSRSALTYYEVLKYFSTDDGLDVETGFTLVKVRIVTGRTHQIRVHFQSIGFPVVGDDTYGEEKVNAVFRKWGLNRPFLHAEALGFRLPEVNEWREFEAEIPEDLKKVLGELVVQG